MHGNKRSKTPVSGKFWWNSSYLDSNKMLFEDSEDLAKPRIKRILFFKPHDNQVRILQEIERILQDAEQ